MGVGVLYLFCYEFLWPLCWIQVRECICNGIIVNVWYWSKTEGRNRFLALFKAWTSRGGFHTKYCEQSLWCISFLDCINRHRKDFISDCRVLELGGGQGWASCIYKRLFSNAHVTVTDISEFAVMSLPKWGSVSEVKVDNVYACKSYEINERDGSLDQIFCFSAAHHFLAHKRTLREISRVLKPGGKAFYFYAPATPRCFYSLTCWIVNKKGWKSRKMFWKPQISGHLPGKWALIAM